MTAPHRARIVGTRHMASAGHYLAAQAALQVLEAGGNAIDAGVAGGLALQVLQSEYVGFGGVAPIMLYIASTDSFFTVSGLGHWPRLTDPGFFRDKYDGAIPPGLLRTVVPAAPDSWITALERFGTFSFTECASVALAFARDGFAVPSMMAETIATYADDYRRWPSSAEIYLPGGRPPAAGDRFIQTDLAGTIAYMMDEESAAAGRGRAAGLAAARDAFYRGDIARAMVAYHREHGGWLREDDLSGFHVEVETPLPVAFGSAEVLSCGPWCQGPVMAEALAILRGIDLRAMGHNSVAYIHCVTEAFKLAYADRHALFGDPHFVDVPIATLLSESYADTRRSRIDPTQASPGMPEPGLPSTWGLAFDRARPADKDPGQLDTSYICTVDRWGNAFSATPSDASAGAPVIPGLGFVPSTRGTQSFTDPASPGAVRPLARPRLTPCPAFARRKGEWIMPIGSPGNDVQPQAMAQVYLNTMVFGMSPQEAVEAPRFATFSYPRSSAPHSYDPGLLKLEGRIGEETLRSLRGMGHDARAWPDWEAAAGGVCTIVRNERSGMMEGAADPRRPAGVAGW